MEYITFKNKKIPEEQRIINNTKYIEQKLKTEKIYFDNMFKNIDKDILLDEEQRKIILTEEDNLMVIAGAGAGKTTTITAKVNYLIEKQKIKDEEILIISFTNKAIKELKERINKDFKHNVRIMTFHKFGYEIIKNNQKPYPKLNTDAQELLKKYVKTKDIDKYITFIKLYKSKGYDETNLKNIKAPQKLKRAYLQYQKELENNNEIDFEDMINKATKIIKENKNIKLRYKYIIIDEYQDISESRFELIKTISKKLDSKIMVVGDDWQCIYSFASSNINLFTNFKTKMGYCETLKITNTYRNSQELIDIAGEFIQKNKKQIPKKLKSNKKLKTPITILKYKNIEKKIEQAIEYLIEKYEKEKNILILGRYKFDKNKIITKNIKENDNIIKYKNNDTKIEYMTIHSSKGLGYDNVILINTQNKKLGFPSKVKTEKIIKQFMNKEKTKYAEERRLFYVALTRTKNEVIIMSPYIKKSTFVKEIKKYKNVKITSNIIKIKK